MATDSAKILTKLVRDIENERQNTEKSYYFTVLICNYLTKFVNIRAGTLLYFTSVIHLLENLIFCLQYQHTVLCSPDSILPLHLLRMTGLKQLL